MAVVVELPNRRVCAPCSPCRLRQLSLVSRRQLRTKRNSVAPNYDAELQPSAGTRNAYCMFNGASDIHATISILKVLKGADDFPHQFHDSRVLLVGAQGIPQSMYKPDGDPVTGGYWDRLASVLWVPDLPKGPIGMYGWGAGTVPRIMLSHCQKPPRICGWEVDPKVLEASNLFMDLEGSMNNDAVSLTLGDALKNDAVVRAGFAGLVVDLFNADGLLPELTQAKVWNRLRSRLRPRGRIIANVGPVMDEDGSPVMEALVALNAIQEAFEGQVYVTDVSEDEHPVMSNVVAMTGPLPAEELWATLLPDDLKHCSSGWIYWKRLE